MQIEKPMHAFRVEPKGGQEQHLSGVMRTPKAPPVRLTVNVHPQLFVGSQVATGVKQAACEQQLCDCQGCQGRKRGTPDLWKFNKSVVLEMRARSYKEGGMWRGRWAGRLSSTSPSICSKQPCVFPLRYKSVTYRDFPHSIF